jgi:cardiolipin synthase
MTIPNLLSISRILLTPLLVILLLEEHLKLALLVFVVAGVTDGLDGLIARLYMQKSRLGAFLDPLADKLLLTTTYVILAFLHLVPRWLSVIVISRDVIIIVGISVLYMQDLPFEIRPSLTSKLTTCFQIFTVIICLVTAIDTPFPLLKKMFYLTTACLTLLSWGQYIYRGVRILHQANNHQRNDKE